MLINLYIDNVPYINFLQSNKYGRKINIYKLNECVATGHNLYYPNILLKSRLNL